MSQTIKRFLGTLVILLPVFVLLVIWGMMVPLSSRFVDINTIYLSIGRLSGLLGLALYSISLVLHVRIRFLGKIVDPAYICKLHHDLGSWALVLLLIHPLALVARFVTTDLYYAAKYLVPLGNLANMAGFLALMIMIAAMLVTYYLKNHHTLWLWIHRSMLVAYVGSFLHLLLVTSDTSASPLLKYYMIILMIIGIIAFAYQRISRYFQATSTSGEAC